MYVKGSASLGVGNKGPDLKLSVGRTAGKWTFKGWSSTEFSGGWKAGVSVGINCKRSIHDVSLMSYSQTIEEIPTVFIYNDITIYLFYGSHAALYQLPTKCITSWLSNIAQCLSLGSTEV